MSHRGIPIALACLGLFWLSGCATYDEQWTPLWESAGHARNIAGTSLLGEPLFALDFQPAQRARLENELDRARARHEEDPTDEQRVMWLGRRLAYLGRYQEAIDIYSDGLGSNPESYRLLRHRGHRYITLRMFELAIADLERASELAEGVADEFETDGAPNPSGIPRSTLQSNIWYHLGLARYLNGDFEGALTAYDRCMEFSQVNDDMLCATTYWLYLTLRKLGLDSDAEEILEPIHADMEILENFGYHRLLRLFKGEIYTTDALGRTTPNSLDYPTVGYGLANWHVWNGEREIGLALYRRIVTGNFWPAFGYIASEAELARILSGGG